VKLDDQLKREGRMLLDAQTAGELFPRDWPNGFQNAPLFRPSKKSREELACDVLRNEHIRETEKKRRAAQARVDRRRSM
jgi:hypothetical protein